jgi:hypothetical protein
MTVPAPDWLYLGLLAWTSLGLVGFLRGDAEDPSRMFRRHLAWTATACVAAHIWLNIDTPAGQGRHLFAAAPHVACMLGWGLLRWCGRPTSPAGRIAAYGIPIAMAGVALYALIEVLWPAYA